MRKFNVLMGERFYQVIADESDEMNGQLIFTRISQDLEFYECARFKQWDAYIEVPYVGDDGVNSEAAEPCA